MSQLFTHDTLAILEYLELIGNRVITNKLQYLLLSKGNLISNAHCVYPTNEETVVHAFLA